tara:strand:+ start:542 stop:2182 length:1641 start_codon:yes stop_codon:yes gene_type:complete
MINLKSNILYYLIFLSSLYISFAYGNLYYSTTLGPDFDYYSGYLDYFYGTKDTTNLEQGLIYFYLISFFSSLKSQYLNQYNYLEIISQGIQLTNFILYVIGLFGVFVFLKNKNYSTKIALIVITILNFFPPLYELRLIFKLEIILFPLLIWAIVFLDEYLKNYSVKFLFFSMVPLSLIFTSKANSGIMIFIYFLIFYFFKVYRSNKYYFYSSILLVFVLFCILSFENYQANGLLIFEHNLPEGFDQKAKLDFLYQVDLINLYLNPFRHSQNGSYLGILILDTFDDYFTISWNDDSSIFYLDRIPFVSHKLKPFLGMFFTSIMYFLIIWKLFKEKKNRYIYLMPLIGIFVQMIISQFTGYNPETGDIAKTYYYSFFLAITFSLIVAYVLKLYFKTGLVVFLLFIISAIHIFGFPKFENEARNDFIHFNNQISYGCTLNNQLFGFENNDCLKVELNFCDYMYSISKKIEIINSQYEIKEYDLSNSKINFEKNSLFIESKNIKSCNNLLSDGFKPVKVLRIQNTPYINILMFMLFLFSSLYFVNVSKRN